jgi:HD-GYP domain-containing protein (c-di-GMP phosphodiesterase class II)
MNHFSYIPRRDTVRIHVEQLQEGCILSKNVLSATNKLLAYKKTVVDQHIKTALQAFLVKEIEVESFLANGEKFQPDYYLDENEKLMDHNTFTISEKSFNQLYVEAIKAIKQLFISWQSGALLDIAKVRQVIIPLVERLEGNEEDILKLYHQSIQEDYIYHHSISVALLSALLGKKLDYKQGDINQIALTGLLCDCGMSKITPNILTKHVPLTENEYRDVKQHPVHSYNLLKQIMSIKEGVKMGVLQHHERIDGSGYPLGVKGDKLHPYSKIVALADTYQAMVSVRPYRKKQSPFKVLEQIMQDEFGKFDIKVINELKKIIIKFSVGTKVKLSNGMEAEIVFVDDQNPTRPMIKAIQSGEILSLKDMREIFIEDII